MLDSTDLQLLKLIERDCRRSNAELAEDLGLSTSACWRRIRALEEAGIIDHYGAVLRRDKMGQNFHAIAHIQLTRHDPEKVRGFDRAIENCPEVLDCFATTGQADYHLRVRCADIDAYNRFLETVIFPLPAVNSVQTNVVMKELKRW